MKYTDTGQSPERKIIMEMYPGNVYIEHYDELRAITKGDGNKAPIGVQLDIFDKRHGLKHDNLARAQYKHWREVETGTKM